MQGLLSDNSPCYFAGPRTAQGLTKAAIEAAQKAVNEKLSGGGSGRSSGGGGGGQVS